MSRKLVFASYLLAFLSSPVLYVRFAPVEVEASTGYPVHNIDTGLNYATIQEAIDAAETLDGHTVFVEEGIYHENVVINKSLSLIGKDRDQTIIERNGTVIGINIQRSRVIVSGFTVMNYLEGICISARSYFEREVIIDGNIIVNNSQYGIRITGSYPWSRIYGDCHIIKDNIIESNRYGISLEGCSNVTIRGNEVKNNTKYGIWLELWPEQPNHARGSHNNLIVNNIIADNDVGVCLLGTRNKFYHNNFVNNQNQVEIMDPHLTLDNNWNIDYPEGGNYWSDYHGIDLQSGPYQNETVSYPIGESSDGIGDPFYIIDANNTDNYPLMGMFSDFIVTSELHIQAICDSTIANFQFNHGESKINLNIAGEYGTAGFCRICVPTALLNAPCRVFVNGTEVPYRLLPLFNGTHNYLYFRYGIWAFGDLYIDREIDMRDIGLASRGFGSYPSHPRWNPLYDLNSDYQVDLVDLVLVARDFGKTY